MFGAPLRRLAGFVILATLLSACAPAIRLDEAATDRPIQISSAPPAARDDVPAPHRTPSPTPTSVPTPPPVPQAFALNLYQEGDFVPQYTFEWCVAASIQMMHNLIDDTGAGTWADDVQQGELWEMARARSSNSFNGANPLGWAQVLNEVGMGPYAVVSITDYEEALRTASRAIADTDRPVGLVMWRGRHVWVMSGFESLGDPDHFPEFSVTGIRVQDPLYPYGDQQWGPSPAPNTLLTPEQLATQFVVREPRRWSIEMPTGYMLVLPLAGAGSDLRVS
ncbi:hypothetical protein AB0N24_15605 [Arthrobacter sp. NPDC093128]|uniref:hypothetical protein n=1 Tax=Arthrobacter sp. NPDC093128 TaxID=3154979 RepID=UPI0034436B1C